MNTNLQINIFQSLILLWMLSTSQGLALDWTSFVPHVSPESGEPPCAHGHNYCLKVKDYPTDTIVKLLKSAPREITSYLHNSLDAKTHSPNMEFQVNLHTNTSSMKKKDEQLCRSYIRIIRPLVARNDGNQWRYIVNVGEHEQLLEIEACANEARKCSEEYTKQTQAVCEQKMVARRLLALDPSGSRLTWHNGMMPSCCQCTLYDGPRRLV